MCGIIAIANLKLFSELMLKDAIKSLYHRGPDGNNIWVSEDKKTVLAQTRLAIIDLETGTQPISDNKEEITIVVNGELYNYQELRKDLINKGHNFKTNSDSEIALYLYKEYGLSFIKYLRGEFAIVIWDQNKERLIAVRDRFGIKPLVYSIVDEQLFMASEAKALFSLGIKAEFNIESFHQAISHQYLLPNQTLFKNIYQLEPAQMMVFEKGKLHLENYWEPERKYSNLFLNDPDYAFKQLNEQLIKAVKYRNQADVPIAYYLSGGIDSSLIASMSAQYSSKKINCFSVAFDDDSYNERKVVSEFARQSNFNVEFVDVSRDDLIEHLPDAIYKSEGLSFNGQLAGKYLLSRAVNKAGFKVVLSGEGADEAFLGYSHLEADYYSDRNIQKNVFKNQVGLMLPEDNNFNDYDLPEQLDFIPTAFKAKIQTGVLYNPLLTNSFKNNFNQKDAFNLFIDKLDWLKKNRDYPKVFKADYIWIRSALNNSILKTLGDGCEMAHSVEGRLPFLDHELFEWAFSIPAELNFQNNLSKYQLRKIALNYLPEEVAMRQKQPFISPPVIKDLTHKRLNMINDLLRTEKFKSNPIFDYKSVYQFLDKLPEFSQTQAYKYDPVLMTILSTAAIQKGFNL